MKLQGSASLSGGGVCDKQHTGRFVQIGCLFTVCFGFGPFLTTAPPKPSKQTQILLDTMSKNTDEEKKFMDEVMDQFDLLFARVNDIGEVQ